MKGIEYQRQHPRLAQDGALSKGNLPLDREQGALERKRTRERERERERE